MQAHDILPQRVRASCNERSLRIPTFGARVVGGYTNNAGSATSDAWASLHVDRLVHFVVGVEDNEWFSSLAASSATSSL